MTGIAWMRRWAIGLSLLGIFILTGCASSPRRAVGIPGAATRTLDFVLPLSEANRNLALLYVAKKRPPRGRWDAWDKEAIEMELQTVTGETRARFRAILSVLSGKKPSAPDLAGTGSIGSLFDPPGASDEALDSRLQGQIITGDLRVGKLHGHYFVFYRRYPQLQSLGSDCTNSQCCRLVDGPCQNDQYCRLVIVNEVATRRD